MATSNAAAGQELVLLQHAGGFAGVGGGSGRAAAGYELLEEQPAAAGAAAADAAAACSSCSDSVLLLVAEAVRALQLLKAYDHPVPMRAVMDSTAAADGTTTKLFARVGGSGAAAVAFLQRWPYVFAVHCVELQHPGPGGVTTGWQVQLQQGAVQWLLTTPQFNRKAAGYRDALLAAVQKAAASSASSGERRGVEIGKVGNTAPQGYLPRALLPFRQVSGGNAVGEQWGWGWPGPKRASMTRADCTPKFISQADDTR
jgi:hypothetical protein